MTFFLIIMIAALALNSHPPYQITHEKKPKIYTSKQEYKYQQKVLREQVKKEYEYSNMPESGYMTVAEYEAKSVDILTSEREVKSYVPELEQGMEYVPVYTYSLVKYNNPPGSPDLNIGRKLQFDREFVSPGVVSPDKSFLIYSVSNFYATSQCVTGDLYKINLDMTKSDVQRVQDANIIKRVQTPIMSTSKDISEKYIFRSLTPVDYSKDGNLLLVKEKVGSIQDGIWQTNLWIYNFRTQKSIQLTEAQETVKYYWRNYRGMFLDDKRWDLYPMGFSAEHPDLIIFNAYAYTGSVPMFLGTWSIDCDGEFTELVSLKESSVKISMNGYKLAKTGIKDPADVHNEAIARQKEYKNQKKKDKENAKLAKKKRHQEYKAKIKEMKQQEREVLKNMK